MFALLVSCSIPAILIAAVVIETHWAESRRLFAGGVFSRDHVDVWSRIEQKTPPRPEEILDNWNPDQMKDLPVSRSMPTPAGGMEPLDTLTFKRPEINERCREILDEFTRFSNSYAKSQIKTAVILEVWGATPGGTEAYRKASSKYESLKKVYEQLIKGE